MRESNMKKNSLYIILFLSLTWYGCTKPEISLPEPQKDHEGKTYFENKEELLTWVNASENTYRTKKLGDFEFSLKRLSPDIMALQELQGNTSDKQAFEEAKSHYTGLIYYRLNISNNQFHRELLKYNLSGSDEYTDRVAYCSFQINRDLYLTNGRDTVPCAIHEFERTFNIESGLNFVVAFPVIDLNRDHTVVLQDQLFDNGIVKFSFGKTGNELPYFKIK